MLGTVDEYSGTGWARFSADRVHRYRIARALTEPGRIWLASRQDDTKPVSVVFVCLNPSTADEKKPDNTLTRCVKFAQLWGGDVVEIVNLFSFRSAYPKDLRKALYRGDGPENDEQILAACCGAHRVVAAWGSSGDFDIVSERAKRVEEMLRFAGVAMHCLARTDDGTCPKHPLARGKHFIPYSKELEVF